jgi:hypothetical protein
MADVKANVDIYLSLDKDGRPCIKFKYLEESNSLDQVVLGQFIKGAQEHGIKLSFMGGECGLSVDSTWDYEIQIKR